MIDTMPVVIKNYIEMKDNVDLDNLKVLNSIFSNIDKYQLKSTNVILDGKIIDGISINEVEKRKYNNLKNGEEENILRFIKSDFNKGITDIKEAYFYDSFIKLVNKFNYVSLEEQVILNFLFEEIVEENRKLQEVNEKVKTYAIK